MATTDIASHPFFFTEQGRGLAKTAAEQIVRSVSSGDLTGDVRNLVDMLNAMADGQSVVAVLLPDELTPSQSAEVLGCSEQHVDELLDAGRLEFRNSGGVRMILRDSLLVYDRRIREANAGVDEMVRLSEEMGLYDD